MFKNISKRSILLFGLTFILQVINLLYRAWAVEPSLLFTLVSTLAFVYVLWWWLMADSKLTGTTWPMDMGYFIWLFWPVLIPYYLFSTRGLKGFIGIFTYIGVLAAGWLVVVLFVTVYLAVFNS